MRWRIIALLIAVVLSVVFYSRYSRRRDHSDSAEQPKSIGPLQIVTTQCDRDHWSEYDTLLLTRGGSDWTFNIAEKVPDSDLQKMFKSIYAARAKKVLLYNAGEERTISELQDDVHRFETAVPEL